MEGIESLLTEAGKLGVIIANALNSGISPNKIEAANKITSHRVLSTTVTSEILNYAVKQQTERQNKQ